MGTARGSVVLRRIRNTGMLSMQLFTEGGRPLKQTVTGNKVIIRKYIHWPSFRDIQILSLNL